MEKEQDMQLEVGVGYTKQKAGRALSYNSI